MGDDRPGRRGFLGAGVGLLASLSGCSRLFIEPETTGTPDGDAPTPAPTGTPTRTPTAPPPSTPAPTPTPVPLPSEDVETRNRRLAVRRTQLETFAVVTYRFDVENVGPRTIGDVEFRVRVRYAAPEISRVVAVAYPRFRFDTDEEEGLDPGETTTVGGTVRFERDGRAENSTETDRFDLELSVRLVRHG
jgi:hypothetical protein